MDEWDTKDVIRIVRRHSGYELTQRQLQSWDRNGVVRADRYAAKNKRIYSFSSIRRLCIVARLLNAKFPAQRLGTVVRNIDRAAEAIGKSWDALKLATDGEAVFVIDGDKGIDAVRGQVVSLILLGDLESRAKAACERETAARRKATGRSEGKRVLPARSAGRQAR